MLVVNWPVFANFALHSDDFSLIYYSSRFGDVSVKQWFTTGFDPYFINFPSHPLHYTRYIRPTVNASIYLDSLIAPSPNSGWMMLGNVLSIAFSAGLVALLTTRTAHRSPPTAHRLLLPFTAVAFFLGSYTNRTALEYISYRGDTLATMFALLAFVLVLDKRNVAFVIATLVVAFFTKETVVGSALICAALAYWRRYSFKQVAAIVAVPVFLFAVWKIVTGGFGGTTLPVKWSPRQMIWNASIVFQFFPFLQFSPIYNLRNPPGGLDGLRDTIAVVLNIAFYALLVRAAVRRDGRTLLLWLAALVAGAVPLILYPEPRFRFFEQACAAVLVAAMIAGIAKPKMRIAAAMVVIVFSLGFYSVHLHRRAQVLSQEFARSTRVQNAVEAAFADTATQRVFYVNDQIGGTGALTMLQLEKLHSHRDDVEVAIISQILPTDSIAASHWQLIGGKFTANATAGRFVWWGATEWTPGFWDGVHRDGFSPNHVEARIPNAERNDYAVVVDENDKAVLFLSGKNQWVSFAN